MRKLLGSHQPEVVPRRRDLPSSVAHRNYRHKVGNAALVTAPAAPRKSSPTAEVVFRVWKLHERMNHISLTVLAK